MDADIVDTINKAIFAWSKNLVLAVPYVVQSVTMWGMWILFGLAVFFFLNPFKNAAASPLGVLPSIDWILLFFDLVIAAFIFVFGFVLSAFFGAGAIGMASRAVETGNTSLDDFTQPAKKRGPSILLAQLVLGVLVIALVFLLMIPQFIVRGDLMTLVLNLFTIAFSLTAYAIVIGDRGGLEGIVASFELFTKNPVDFFLMWFFTSALAKFLFIAVAAACLPVLAVACLFLPADLSGAAILSSVALPAFAVALFLCMIIFMALVLVVVAPVTATIWSAFYLEQKSAEVGK